MSFFPPPPTPGQIAVNGTDGDDVLVPTSGGCAVNGGPGIDTMVYGGPRASYAFSQSTFGLQVTVAADSFDVLSGVERITFADANVAIDIDGNAGTVARILGAVFGADLVGNPTYVGIGLKLVDSGLSFQTLMQYALDIRLGTAPTDKQLVDLLYANVMGTPPSADVEGYYVHELQQGTYTQNQLAVLAASTPQNAMHIGLTGLASEGLLYTHA